MMSGWPFLNSNHCSSEKKKVSGVKVLFVSLLVWFALVFFLFVFFFSVRLQGLNEHQAAKMYVPSSFHLCFRPCIYFPLYTESKRKVSVSRTSFFFHRTFGNSPEKLLFKVSVKKLSGIPEERLCCSVLPSQCIIKVHLYGNGVSAH